MVSDPKLVAEAERLIADYSRRIQGYRSQVGSKGEQLRAQIPRLEAEIARLRQQVSSQEITSPDVIARAEKRTRGTSRAPEGSLSARSTRPQIIVSEEEKRRRRTALNKQIYGAPSVEENVRISQELRSRGTSPQIIQSSEKFKAKQATVIGGVRPSSLPGSITPTKYVEEAETKQEQTHIKEEASKKELENVFSRMKQAKEIQYPTNETKGSIYQRALKYEQEKIIPFIRKTLWSEPIEVTEQKALSEIGKSKMRPGAKAISAFEVKALTGFKKYLTSPSKILPEIALGLGTGIVFRTAGTLLTKIPKVTQFLGSKAGQVTRTVTNISLFSVFGATETKAIIASTSPAERVGELPGRLVSFAGGATILSKTLNVPLVKSRIPVEPGALIEREEVLQTARTKGGKLLFSKEEQEIIRPLLRGQEEFRGLPEQQPRKITIKEIPEQIPQKEKVVQFLRKEKPVVFGSFGTQISFPKGEMRKAGDIDIQVQRPIGQVREELVSSLKIKKPLRQGQALGQVGVEEKYFDIKPAGRLEENPFIEPVQYNPSGIPVTKQSEQLARKLARTLTKNPEKYNKDIKDAMMILKGLQKEKTISKKPVPVVTESKVKEISKRFQESPKEAVALGQQLSFELKRKPISRYIPFEKEYAKYETLKNIGKQFKPIPERQISKKASNISSRLPSKLPSYISPSVLSSRLPSKILSRLPSKLSSRLPSKISSYVPSSFIPSKVPPSKITPSKVTPSKVPSEIPPSKIPPKSYIPSKIPPSKIPFYKPPTRIITRLNFKKASEKKKVLESKSSIKQPLKLTRTLFALTTGLKEKKPKRKGFTGLEIRGF